MRPTASNQVVAASDRAASLTRQLLTFSRKQVMQLQPLNLSDAVANLAKMLKRIIGEDIQLQAAAYALAPAAGSRRRRHDGTECSSTLSSTPAMPCPRAANCSSPSNASI